MSHNSDHDVSPYLCKPPRSFEEALRDISEGQARTEAAAARNRKAQVVSFPFWRKATSDWLRPGSGGRRRA